MKILCENFTLVKSYGKTNINVFVLSLWEKYRWGLTSFGQFIIRAASKPERNNVFYIIAQLTENIYLDEGLFLGVEWWLLGL